MALGEILKAVCGADKATLAAVAKVLRHEDEAAATSAVADPDVRLVTQREAAKRLGISSVTVWRLLRDGKLKGVNVRGKVRVRMDSVMRFALGGKAVA